MLVIAGTMMLKPEKREEALELVDATVCETRKEGGCLQYDFSLDRKDPNKLHLFEEWEDQAALDRHMATPHLKRFFAAVPEVTAIPLDVKLYTIQAAQKLG